MGHCTLKEGGSLYCVERIKKHELKLNGCVPKSDAKSFSQTEQRRHFLYAELACIMASLHPRRCEIAVKPEVDARIRKLEARFYGAEYE